MAITGTVSTFEVNGKTAHVAGTFDYDPPGAGDITFVYVQVGTEEPQKVGSRDGNFNLKVDIGKSLELLKGTKGNKPLPLTLWGQPVYTAEQGAAWCHLGAGASNRIKTKYL